MHHQQNMSARDNNRQNGGRWFLIFIGLSVATLGFLFVWLMAQSGIRAIQMRSWDRLPCRILRSEITERRNDPLSAIEFSHAVLFGYDTASGSKTSDQLSLRGSPWSSQRAKSEASLKKFPVGSKMICFVNPENHAQAVLKPDSLAPLYSIWFPGLFVIGGLVMTWRAVVAPNQLNTK
jgi:hypothetical protein